MVGTKLSNLTKYVKVGNGWRFCPVVTSSTGRIRTDQVMVAGKSERHPEGCYSLDWYEDGKRIRRSVGKNAVVAQTEQQRENLRLQSNAFGLALPATADKRSPITLDDACREYLEDANQRKKKTRQQYQVALEYLQEYLGSVALHAIGRRELLGFMRFLKEQKALDERTIHTKLLVVRQMLKAHSITGILRRSDCPRFVMKTPEVYSREELATFFATCDRREQLLFSFFLGTGFREQEVEFTTWQDMKFDIGKVVVTAKPDYGFIPKSWEERAIVIPDKLLEELRAYKASADAGFRLIFPTSAGKPDGHLLRHCKSVAYKANLNCGVCKSERGTCLKGPWCRHWFLHKFRATYATSQLRHSVDIRTLQQLMGHKDLASTMRYLTPDLQDGLHAKVNNAFTDLISAI